MLIHSWQPDVRESGPHPGSSAPVEQRASSVLQQKIHIAAFKCF